MRQPPDPALVARMPYNQRCKGVEGCTNLRYGNHNLCQQHIRALANGEDLANLKRGYLPHQCNMFAIGAGMFGNACTLVDGHEGPHENHHGGRYDRWVTRDELRDLK